MAATAVGALREPVYGNQYIYYVYINVNTGIKN